MSDEEIIGLYWKRDETAITESAGQYGRYCQSIALRILESAEDSEECVNDTWLKSWNALPPGKPDRLSVFFGKITRNLAFDRYRKKHAGKRGGGETALVLEELEDCVSSGSSVEKEFDDSELSRSINQFVRSLPDRERNIFLARYWYGFSIIQIGKKFGMKENSVKVNLHRSRTKLKEHLLKEGFVYESGKTV